MNEDGSEWMNDWYQDDYYGSSSAVNPQGPATGQWKVTRSARSGEDKRIGANNLTRNPTDPTVQRNPETGKFSKDLVNGGILTLSPVGFSWRCVVNSTQRVENDSKN